MGDEASGSSKPTPRKLRFKPKIPPPRPAESGAVKTETPDAVDATLSSELQGLVKQLQQGSGRPKLEKKVAPVQVAFGYGDTSTSARSFGIYRGGSRSSRNDNHNEPAQSGPASNDFANAAPPSTDDDATPLVQKKHSKYTSPWDHCSYYPVTLPLRRPFSGNPEVLDEEEFREASQNVDHEASMNSAVELGLSEEGEEAQMFFFQFPAYLPLAKRSATSKESGPSTSRGRGRSGGCSLEEVPAGRMGKMLVYASGAVKMKLGDSLFDVSPGSDCIFAQDVAAINAEHRHCCVLGELNKRVILTPDLDDLLDNHGKVNTN